ncbi:hypothetical protein LTR99_009423 [Exophiala xenobiotica]|nr:hypothetical protein LTR92_002250 [Exophiala xenobiotica]KAK5241277.1 hypothetical protein LTS06_012162 [Exophiala xenobiotica]KAK5294617.1 hypothetical protein LTR99_009423 [Exophiala xenobiotica]KAK5302122.1 hypothetical protein LTR14_000371 [Exophiala xenobiotica]KAK5387950.1 hypothetical protein LTS13_000886 [Exophiala xenobiotica]
MSDTNRTQEELLAAEALIELFGCPPPVQYSANSLDDVMSNEEDPEVIGAANVLMSLRQNLPDEAVPASSTWFGTLIQHRPLRNFVQAGLTTSVLGAEAEHKTETVLKAMTTRSCVQEALWYLEGNEWEVKKAIKQYESDESLRSANAAQIYQQLNQQANAITSQAFQPSMLAVPIPARSGDGARPRVVRFPGHETFDAKNADHMRALNQWRNDISRYYKGPPEIGATVKRTRYTKFEERLMRNAFGDRIDEFKQGAAPNNQSIARFYNEVFQGRYLPGEINPCPERKGNFITTFIDRKFKLDDKGNRVQTLGNYHAALKIQAVRQQEQAEYDARWAPGARAADVDDADEEDVMQMETGDYVQGAFHAIAGIGISLFL